MSTPDGRRLICCFDGTGNEFGNVRNINSSIVELFGILTKSQPEKQLVYYQAGIGTYTSSLILTPFAAKVASLADSAVAWYLDEHVKEGYTFLMQNYRPGDKICLFGFSRGAYIARALAGMLHKVGLLPPHNDEQMQFAYKLFKRTDKSGWKLSEQFKKIFTAHDVRIEYVGVWDTVCSVGIIPRQLPFTCSNYAIKTFRQALSLDERRSKFLPNTWNTPSAREAVLGYQPKPKPREEGVSKDEWEYEPPEEHMTDVLEVWFTGCHADVGGGSVADPVQLSRISLAWMIKQCHLTGSGIHFEMDAIRELGIDPETFELRSSPLPNSLGSLADPGSKDHYALAPIFDQLVAAPFWWILEVIPLIHSYYHEGRRYRYISRNFGRGRYIYPPTDAKIKIHKSVRHRMDDVVKYLPRVQNFDEIESVCEWVD
ncbi:hypothetical protein BOTBODRAFT_35481 [Botryobasidium botryosum FD-172 SS1]|uniref:T6SS Phospholipase effector Tle1-like catalytic domain-containing protein n=1 Tax=Botryobasidium botryosum (strain FD-172 SS1) TaxID=930990 RepID=A0A067MGZ9_BOTB1|nr:hypothetical protein BOTBODRAFT_35481 [Botryobasidium botryosum FD-172 SS1]